MFTFLGVGHQLRMDSLLSSTDEECPSIKRVSAFSRSIYDTIRTYEVTHDDSAGDSGVKIRSTLIFAMIKSSIPFNKWELHHVFAYLSTYRAKGQHPRKQRLGGSYESTLFGLHENGLEQNENPEQYNTMFCC